MPFGESTTAHLAGYDKQVDYLFELRTGHPESSSWQAFRFADFSLSHDSGGPGGAPSPALLQIELLNEDLSYSNEVDPANRVQLFAQARLSCTVDGASEVLFYGRVYRVEAQDCRLYLTCQDWLALLHECECELNLAPEESSEISPARQLFLAGGGAFGSVFGFSYSGAGDPAFNTDSPAGTRRRAWAPGDIRLWYDSAASQEVPPKHYLVQLQSGTVSILEDTAGRSYYASGVRCYLEGTLDWSTVFETALRYPAALGGPGAASEELDLPLLGLDLAAPLYFRGRVGELFEQVLSLQQANLRLVYDSRAAGLGEPGSPGRFKLRLIEQKAAGEVDWELLHPQSVAQPRDIRELYSRVVLSGQAERPRNTLTESTTEISSIVSSGDWFAWDGLNVEADSSFAAAGPRLWDGDASQGASVHNLAASEGGGTGFYDSWYGFIEADLGSVQRISRVRAVLPGSRNPNAQAGHQGKFWPGLRVEVSEDGSAWRLLSAQLAGRYPPHSLAEAAGRDLLAPRARYLRVLCGAYKHGFDNEDDPSIGLAELEVYTSEEYRIVREIDPAAGPPSFYSYSADYDRDGSIDQWQRNAPGLWQRLGGRHRTRFERAESLVNELLAADRALDLLSESVRLFQQLRWRAVCDPRVRLYDTVAALDELNGDISTLLVERVLLRPGLSEISGTDYRAAAL
ncbi:hypothetical protein IT575_01160 [bacterium]|nr:hypothetical protein [bacterium]